MSSTVSNNPLVSIIMPAYNAEAFIGDAISSVINQEHTKWELLIIDDGSKDKTGSVAKTFQDPRIKYYYKENAGVSAARNMALKLMSGDFFCFLDADDILTPLSISARLEKFFQNPNLAFVDGIVLGMDVRLKEVHRRYKPAFKGDPELPLKQLSETCFYGITWMVKRDKEMTYQFNTGVKYSEDLLFYLSIARQGMYDYVEDVVYMNRKVETSAMQNLKALAKGYKKLLRYLLNHYEYSIKEKIRLIYKVRLLIIKLTFRHYLNG